MSSPTLNGSRGTEFVGRDGAFGLEADVDRDFLVADGNDLALDDFAFAEFHDHLLVKRGQVLGFAMHFRLVFGQFFGSDFAAFEPDYFARTAAEPRGSQFRESRGLRRCVCC